MKVEQQDVLVSLIYKCPNQFLYNALKDIGDNFEAFLVKSMKIFLPCAKKKILQKSILIV